MGKSESQLRAIENAYPSLSGIAFATAREQTLAAGQSVLQSEGAVIFEVFPDGRKKVVKQIEPPTPVERGRKIQIK
ncbi:MAG: hypothetical protein WCN98_18580, partial [Verrucomicrobiaceae bacterium]